MKEKSELLFSVTIDEFEIQTFRSGGKGGQNQNKRDSGVRLIHHPSGARGESREERSQHANKRKALVKLAGTPQFKYWVSQVVSKMDNKMSAEEWVEQEMQKLDHFKIEYKDENGRWTVVK